MNRTEVFDLILKHLNENPDYYISLIPTCKKEFGIEDGRLITSISEELLERNWANPKNDDRTSLTINYTGQQILKEYGSYSAYLSSESKKIKRERIERNTPDRIKIGLMLIFGVSAAALGWIKYMDDLEIEQQRSKIESLERAVDSLKLRLEERTTTSGMPHSDSLPNPK